MESPLQALQNNVTFRQQHLIRLCANAGEYASFIYLAHQ
jgi:hypothetical protein